MVQQYLVRVPQSGCKVFWKGACGKGPFFQMGLLYSTERSMQCSMGTTPCTLFPAMLG